MPILAAAPAAAAAGTAAAGTAAAGTGAALGAGTLGAGLGAGTAATGAGLGASGAGLLGAIGAAPAGVTAPTATAAASGAGSFLGGKTLATMLPAIASGVLGGEDKPQATPQAGSFGGHYAPNSFKPSMPFQASPYRSRLTSLLGR